MAIIVALDIGGTFSDLVYYDSTTDSFGHAKAATTPAPVDGIIQCLDKASVNMTQSSDFVHGSTIAINTVLEHDGAKCALIVTKGMRDTYRIGRQNRPESYNFFFHRPRPLVGRSSTFELGARMNKDGEILEECSDAHIDDLVAQVAALEPEAVAICLMHSYANPEHEQRVADRLRKALPAVYVTASHEIIREFREYERTSSTVLNAYVGPRVTTYLDDLEELLESRGFDGRLFLMQSNGGVMSPSVARVVPVAMMESGPVGGIAATAELGKRLGMPNLIAFDMGGTTAKASLVANYQLAVAETYYIGGYANGQPLMLPAVDVIEVGTGGGSIASIDAVGALQVGPESAGGYPGPISYGWGGTKPTVTDANLVLGRLDPSAFLGGEMPLDAEAAAEGILRDVAGPLGLSVADAAHGIVDIALASMSLAVRAVSVERGYDPREFALVAFGGAGPLHACAIARDLHVPRVIVPLFPGHFSAMGMLGSTLRHDFVRTFYTELERADWQTVLATADELLADGKARLIADGADPATLVLEIGLDVRYVGQEFTLITPVSRAALVDADTGTIRRDFAAIHHQRYGHSSPTEAVELVNVRVTASAPRSTPVIRIPQEPGDPLRGRRHVVLERGAAATEVPIYYRDRLHPDDVIEGPAVIEEYASTTVLWPGDRARRLESGELEIEIAG